jgi:hypothetical protein
MRAQMAELMVRIRDLKELLNHSIRIREGGISREIRKQIEVSERELKILKVQLNKENETIS